MPSSRLVPRLSDRTLPTSLTPSKCCEISSSKGVCTHPKTPCSIPILSVSPRSAMSSIRYTRPLRHVVLRSFLFCLRMDSIAIECGSRGGEELFKESRTCSVASASERVERIKQIVRTARVVVVVDLSAVSPTKSRFRRILIFVALIEGGMHIHLQLRSFAPECSVTDRSVACAAQVVEQIHSQVFARNSSINVSYGISSALLGLCRRIRHIRLMGSASESGSSITAG